MFRFIPNDQGLSSKFSYRNQVSEFEVFALIVTWLAVLE